MATDNTFGITCPEDCVTTDVFVEIETVNPDCPPPPKQSEITDLFLMHPTKGIAPADWTLAAGVGNWNDVIDNADITETKVKRLTVSGTIAEPDRTEVEMTNFKTFFGKGTYTLEATIKSLPDKLRDFLRKFQCGTIAPVFWYKDAGGFMYGANEGICSLSAIPTFPHEAGRDSYTSAILRITWEAQTDPERIDSPI